MTKDLLRPGERNVIKVGKVKAGEHTYPRIVISLQLQAIGLEPGDEAIIEVQEDHIIIKNPRRKT